jgi:hypothetical protein
MRLVFIQPGSGGWRRWQVRVSPTGLFGGASGCNFGSRNAFSVQDVNCHGLLDDTAIRLLPCARTSRTSRNLLLIVDEVVS